ncbi:ABC transporter ATP-binding protein, partial [Acidobacteriota bacterium]
NLCWQKVNSHSTSLDYVEKILHNAKESSHIKSGLILFEGLKREINFDNISFAYEKNSSKNFILKDLSFRISSGSFIAIVGSSGAGKSTLVDLIPRLRDVTKGEIRLDGVAIKEFDLKSLRSRIGYLSQEPFLFNDTVFNNIVYGLDEKIGEEDVIEAAKKAYAHEFINEMPLKYKTDLGDRGLRLSRGQRQRIVLAKLILHNPDIIILDEYTSSLDSESERYIQAALTKITENRTVIVIAHRLATIKKADQILVLENGKIAEFGNFQTLINKNNSFRKLFEEQLFF